MEKGWERRPGEEVRRVWKLKVVFDEVVNLGPAYVTETPIKNKTGKKIKEKEMPAARNCKLETRRSLHP